MATLLLSLSLSCCIASRLLRIPEDVTHKIFSHLDINEKTKANASLSQYHYHYFNQTYGDEFQDVHQLKKWFADNDYIGHLDEIFTITQELELSELYHLFLPSFLSTLYTDWMANIRSNVELTETLNAMMLYPMSLHEFNWHEPVSGISDEMRLLVLASRALLNYFIPSSYANNKDLGILTYQPYIDSVEAFNYWSNYNWLRPDPSYFPQEPNSKSFCFQTNLWPIYFSYLYEFYFFALDVESNSLNAASVFHLEGKAKSNLLKLIRKYNFIPWSDRTLQRIRADFKSCDVHEIYADFYRIEKELHLGLPLKDERYMFRTYLIFHLLEEMNCSLPIDPVAQQSLKWHMVDLAYLNWNAFKQNAYELSIHILINMLSQTDQFLDDFVALGISVRDPFASDLIYRLWQAKNVYVRGEMHGYFKTMIVNGVINRSKYYWFDRNDSVAAMQEISKLARDPRLFEQACLSVVINNAQEINADPENEYVLNMVFVLTKLRPDWNWDSAIEQALGQRVRNILEYHRPALTDNTVLV